jgi:hypothetical protein
MFRKFRIPIPKGLAARLATIAVAFVPAAMFNPGTALASLQGCNGGTLAQGSNGQVVTVFTCVETLPGGSNVVVRQHASWGVNWGTVNIESWSYLFVNGNAYGQNYQHNTGVNGGVLVSDWVCNWAGPANVTGGSDPINIRWSNGVLSSNHQSYSLTVTNKACQ